MRRRDFVIQGAAAAALWPLAANAQQAAMPTIGFLHSGSAETNTKRLAGFRKGLGDAGFVEGRNVTIEFRWADGHNDWLPGMAADLIRKPVTLITTLSTTVAALAAKAATTTIPIVFLVAEDPVKLGLAQSFNHPGGNATGITSLNSDIAAKRLGLLHETLPKAAVAVLVNPANPNAKPVLEVVQATARKLGIELQLLDASTDGEIDAAFLAIKPGTALLISTDPFFFSRHRKLAALAARHAVPTMYDNREFAAAGGLMSYGTDIPSGWEQCGLTVGRILKGEKPGDLPIVQAAKFEMVINQRTAKALNIEVPSKLLFTADEVVE
jgi:putative tryptophan/tyrosine transport system substrate-binding protein